MAKRIGVLCIILGFCCLFSAVGLIAYNQMEEKSAEAASAAMLHNVQQITETEGKAPAAEYPAEMPTVDVDGNPCIGMLSIPVLELELPVISEWDYDRLKIAPCRQYGSTKTDDLVIAAHNYASHFGRLAQLRTGDLLTFTDMDAETILYGVVTVDVLEPTAVDTVKDSEFDLVLYTCTYGGENRVAVFCDRIVR